MKTKHTQEMDLKAYAIRQKAISMFEQRFKSHMKGGHPGQFRTEYKTLHDDVIIPLMEELLQQLVTASDKQMSMIDLLDEVKRKCESQGLLGCIPDPVTKQPTFDERTTYGRIVTMINQNR